MRHALSLVLVAACGGVTPAPTQPATAQPATAHGHAHHQHAGHAHHRFEDAEKWAKMFDDPARDAWQQPDSVIAELGLTPTMTVADVGAGTGYFAVRLAKAVPQGRVIATDLEPDMVRYLTERAAREQLPNLTAGLATADGPGLAPGSVDRILIVDVWHHLADRVAYGKALAAALRPGGALLIVDFKLDSERGPPPQMKLAPDAIVADLRAAGFTTTVNDALLPDQYIVRATRTGG